MEGYDCASTFAWFYWFEKQNTAALVRFFMAGEKIAGVSLEVAKGSLVNRQMVLIMYILY